MRWQSHINASGIVGAVEEQIALGPVDVTRNLTIDTIWAISSDQANTPSHNVRSTSRTNPTRPKGDTLSSECNHYVTWSHFRKYCQTHDRDKVKATYRAVCKYHMMDKTPMNHLMLSPMRTWVTTTTHGEDFYGNMAMSQNHEGNDELTHLHHDWKKITGTQLLERSSDGWLYA